MPRKSRNRPENQMNLTGFEEKQKAPPDGSTGQSYYLLTNRNNLLDILSTGVIKPAAWYNKYYDDLGEYCRDAIPLLTEPPSSELVVRSVPDDETSFPVLLQLDIGQVAGSCYIVTPNYELKEAKFPVAEEAIAVLLARVLPVSLVSLVYFRDYQELKEYKIRKFSDVPEGLVDLHFDKAYFDGPVLETERFLETLSGASEFVAACEKTKYLYIDSLAGMVSFLGRYATRDISFQLSVYSQLLRVYIDLFEEPSRKDFPQEFEWINCLRVISPEMQRFEQASSELVKEWIDLEYPTNRILENLLFAASLQKVIGLDPDDFLFERYFEDVLGINSALIGATQIPDIDPFLEKLDSSKKYADQLRTGLITLDQFFAEFPPEKQPVMAALHLFGLRHRPSEAVSLMDEDFAYPVSVRAITIALTGALFGRTRLKLEYQASTNLKTLIDEVGVRHLNHLCGSITLPRLMLDIKVEIEQSEGGDIERINTPDAVLIMRQVDRTEKRHPDEVSEELFAESEEYQEHLAEPGRILFELSRSDLNDPESILYKIALEICRVMLWDDLISMVISIHNQDFVLEYRPGKYEFRVPGFVHPSYRINRSEEFIQRLSSITGESLERRASQDLVSLINDFIEHGKR